VVVLAFVFGFAALRIVPESRESMYAGAQRINNLILEFTKLIILFTPLGVFGLVAALVAEEGLSAITDMWLFCLVVIGALAIHVLIVLPALAYAFGRFNPYTYLRQVLKPILVGFSTASSSATLPVTMTTAVEKGGIEKKVAEFTFPMGSTVNMDGTCLYQGIVALFVAQALGVDLSLSQQFTIAFSVVIASIGASGIPGAGIVMLAVVFAAVGLPIEAIAIIMSVDRFLDMFRTASNICGDLIVAKIVNRYYLKTHGEISSIELDDAPRPFTGRAHEPSLAVEEPRD
jgi:proton glutamate symport protein